MNMNIPATNEYIEVHQNTLQAIMNGVSSRVAADPDITIEQAGPDVLGAPAHLWSTPYTAEAIDEVFGGLLDADEAVQLAEAKNSLEVTSALQEFIALQVAATMFADADVDYAGERLLEYEEATKEVSFGTDDEPGNVRFAISKLSGLAIYGSTAKYSVVKRDEFVAEDFNIRTLGDRIHSVTYRVEPKNDEQLNHWCSVLGVEVAGLIRVAAGIFENEEELDEKLSQVWVNLQGTSKEEEITTVIDEVRTRALAAKASSELTYNFSLDLPSAQQLAEIAAEVSRP